jgi:hypothetical protein
MFEYAGGYKSNVKRVLAGRLNSRVLTFHGNAKITRSVYSQSTYLTSDDSIKGQADLMLTPAWQMPATPSAAKGMTESARFFDKP